MTRGSVVLTPFPFTDLQGSKVRPAIVVSPPDRMGDDVILAFISSVKPARPHPTDLLLSPSDPDFAATGLKADSILKCDKLATVQRRILLGELGTLSATLMAKVDQRLRLALGL